MPSPLITLLDAHNQPIGPFPVEEVRQRLQSGEFRLDQFAFVEGLTEWTPLATVLSQFPAPFLPPPFVPTASPAPFVPAPFAPAPAVPGYAGFWLRFVAYLLDLLLIWSVLYSVAGILMLIGDPDQFRSFMLGHEYDADDSPFWIKAIFAPILVLGPLLYFALMESGPQQGTLGKMALGLKVTDLAGNRLSFWHAFGRAAAKIVTNLTCCLLYVGYMMAGFTDKKQALHDIIASTLVWRK